MLSAISASIIAIGTLLVLTQTVSISVTKKDKLLLKFNFIFLAFSLDLSNGNSSTQDKRKKRGGNIPYTAIIRLLSYFLSGSHLVIRAFNFPKADPDYANAPIIGTISILRSALIAYFISAAASFEFDKSENDIDFDINAIIYTPFVHLILAALLYLKALYKIKRKKRAR